ncbi:hypothetical protein VWM68_11530, partial [Campylobacter coli]
TLLIVSKGLIKGIERLNVVIMPSLFIMLIFMLLYCMSFQNGFTRNEITNFLEQCNIQTRTLFAGNITRHPAFTSLKLNVDYK